MLNNEVGQRRAALFETAAGKVVIMLPGPPSELIPMLYHEAVPYLLRREQAAIVSKKYPCVSAWAKGRSQSDRRPDAGREPDGRNLCEGRGDVRAGNCPGKKRHRRRTRCARLW